MSLAALIVLARTLVKTAPPGLSALARRALSTVERRAQAGQDAQAERQRLAGQGAADPRNLDTLADRCIGALYRQLESFTLLTAEDGPESAQASELLTLLFPEGLTLVNLPYVEQLTAMEVLVARIDDEKLAAAIDDLCGPVFLRALRRRLGQYRAMVQASLQKADASHNLQDHRLKLGAAIVSYATKVVALYDEDEDQPSIERIQTALRPIAALRSQLARRAATDEAATPDAPDPADTPATPTTDPAK